MVKTLFSVLWEPAGSSEAAQTVFRRIIWGDGNGGAVGMVCLKNVHIVFSYQSAGYLLSPFMLSEADPDTEAGELVARDCGADDTGSSTMTSMSLLLSSASASGGNEPGWSSLLREI